MAINQPDLSQNFRTAVTGTVPLTRGFNAAAPIPLPSIPVPLADAVSALAETLYKSNLLTFDPRTNNDHVDRAVLAAMPEDQTFDLRQKLVNARLYPEGDRKAPAGMMEFSLDIAADANTAQQFIARDSLQGRMAGGADMMKMQVALNRLGYDVGEIDGSFGPKTAKALTSFLTDHPETVGEMSPQVKQRMESAEQSIEQIALTSNAAIARTYLKQIALPSQDLSEPSVKKIQESLTRLGYKPGPDDGEFGARTARALNQFLQDNKQDIPHVSSSLRMTMERVLPSTSKTFGDRPYNFMPITGETPLNPDLADAMQRKPGVANYVRMTMDAAEKYNLDGNLLANQFWQESKYNPASNSGKAQGIAQFKPETGRQYGLKTLADRRDPEKSIEAGAHHMRDLTDIYGSQKLALVAYNGGQGAVDHVAKQNGANPTLEEWMKAMERERARYGTDNPNKWRTQTYDYIQKVNPDYWSLDTLQRTNQFKIDPVPESVQDKEKFIKPVPGTEPEFRSLAPYASLMDDKGVKSGVLVQGDFRMAASNSVTPKDDPAQPGFTPSGPRKDAASPT